MSFNLDDSPIDFECPECGSTVHSTLGRLRRSAKLECPNGHAIQVDGADLDRGAREVESGLDDLNRTLKNMGGDIRL
jgi:hypothetical protein